MNYRDYKYNLVEEKKIIEFINSADEPLQRKDIKKYALSIGYKDRTLSDMLKKNVMSGKIQRISQGLYTGTDERKVGSLEVTRYSFEMIEDEPKIVISMVKVLDTDGKYIKFAKLKDVEPYLSMYPISFSKK